MPGLGEAPPAGQAAPPPEDAEPEAAATSSSGRKLSGSGPRGALCPAAPAASSSSLPAPVRAALELAEARRRLLEAESRRRVASELESRVHALHRVFLEAERRLVHRAEGLGRLGGGAAQAELQLAARGGGQQQQRLRKGLRRARRVRPPALLASALGLGLGGCAPWARRAEGPESPFRPRAPRPGHAPHAQATPPRR